MPEPLTGSQVSVPSNYAGKTVEWARTNLLTVDLHIRVAVPEGEFHPPTTDELGLVITANAPGSQQGQSRPAGGTAGVFIPGPST